MPNRRSYSDDDLTTAVAQSRCWADVAAMLGKSRAYNTVWIQKVADRLGLATGHLVNTRGVNPILAAGPHPFTQRAGGKSRCSGLSAATQWFLRRGYPVSIPIEPAFYDLIAESDQGLKRVQVKTTRSRDCNSGVFDVQIQHRLYDARSPERVNGRFRWVPYTPGEIDLFFIITSAGQNYIIPIEVTGDRKSLNLDSKYADFLVG